MENGKVNDGFREAALKEFESSIYTIDELSSLSLAQSIVRLWMADYILILLTGASAMFFGIGGMSIGGVNSPAGDALFGLGAFLGGIAGLIAGDKVSYRIRPKRHSALEAERMGFLFIAMLVTAIVGLIVGGLVSDQVKVLFFPNEKRLPLTWFIGTTTVVGGFVMSLLSIVWLAVTDKSRRKKYIEYFREWSESRN